MKILQTRQKYPKISKEDLYYFKISFQTNLRSFPFNTKKPPKTPLKKTFLLPQTSPEEYGKKQEVSKVFPPKEKTLKVKKNNF